MKQSERRAFFVTSAILIVSGYLHLEHSENLFVSGLFFLAAAMFLYGSLDTVKVGCSISEINEISKSMVSGEGNKSMGKSNRLKMGFLTFSVILVFFGLGFGFGKLIYRILN